MLCSRYYKPFSGTSIAVATQQSRLATNPTSHSSYFQVRASTLQDLIYKRGQAGITKASVTIVFNNDDRSKSPVGFEAYRQITVTRQVSYHLSIWVIG
jgi:hypothetical protein